MEVWYRFLTRGDGVPSTGAAVAALVGAGLSVREHDASAAGRGGPGVVFFDEADAELYDFLREFSRGGLERVLAVASTRAALAGGVAWNLLRAGASDAFAW